MNTSLPILAFASIVALVLLVLPNSSDAAPSPMDEQMGMKNALEYLQQLDQYYAKAARPRYVKMSFKF